MKLGSQEIRMAVHAMHCGARPRDLLRQMGILADHFNALVSPANRTRRFRSPRIGKDTKFRRRRFLQHFIRALQKCGYKVDYLDQLTPEHIAAVARYWHESGLATRTIQTRLSAVRMLTEWLGMPSIMPPNRELLPRSRWRARTVATRDHTWSGNGLDVEVVARWIGGKDLWIRYALLLARHFGLRMKEASLLHPDEADQGTSLLVRWGPKNGRHRKVTIYNARQRELLDEVKHFVPPGESLIGLREEITWRQARHRIDEVVNRELQISKKGARVTPHGLRHEFACSEYWRLTGEPAPIQGGRPVPRDIDKTARRQIAQDLGHNRTSVTGAYLGPVLRARRSTAKCVPAIGCGSGVMRTRGHVPT